MLKPEVIANLKEITPEEKEILSGQSEINRNIYMRGGGNTINSQKLLELGKLITVRKHTRFIDFPEHTHDYVELVYMLSGQTVHIVDGKKIILRQDNYFTSSVAPKFNSNSYSIIAKTVIPQNGVQGVLLSAGSALNGISLFIKDKKLVFAYNAEGKLFEVKSSKDIPAGNAELRADVNYSNEGKNKSVSLFINGEQVGSKDLGKIANAGPGVEGLEVGRDLGLPVSPAYKTPYIFTGKLNEVILELKDASVSKN